MTLFDTLLTMARFGTLSVDAEPAAGCACWMTDSDVTEFGVQHRVLS